MSASSRLTFSEACERLPVVLTLDGVPVRWIGDLIDQGYGADIGMMSEAAWGYLEDSGWQEALEGAGPLHDEHGQIRPTYAKAFSEAVYRLSGAGRHAGPASGVAMWAAWLANTMAATHDVVKEAAASAASG